jgi:hypothetical protein
MAVRISREIAFGGGSRGFRFENHNDRTGDRKQYQKGLTLENARLRPGSLAQRLFDRLSYQKKDEAA